MRNRLFFIGIGGYGISAIARLVHEMGYSVSGSDRSLSPLAMDLRQSGINVYEGHHRDHLVGIDMVIRSSAIPDDNVEVIAARNAGIPVLKRADFLGELMDKHTGIAIAGTHGKTTTTAMISWLLSALDQDPSYIIGGVSKNLGLNAHAGQGKYFVIEADEYDRMFLGLRPHVSIITNCEHDHPDCFPTPFDYQQAFLAFARNVNPQGYLLICGDDPGNRAIIRQLKNKQVITYGLNPENDFQAKILRVNSSGSYSFEMVKNDSQHEDNLVSIDLIVPGKHNVRNALAALVIIYRSSLDLARAARLMHQFNGTGRRFDIVAETNGITLIDDYAHHPTEIEATLEAARSRYLHNRIWVVWQPHTFSRTQALLDRFSTAFTQADQVIISDIFASREQLTTFSAANLIDKIKHPHVQLIPKLADIATYLIRNIKSSDVVLVLSAGDAEQINKLVLQGIEEKEGA